MAFATHACNDPTSGTSPNVTLVVRESGSTCTAKKRVAPEQERNRHRGLVNLYLTQVCIDKGMHVLVHGASFSEEWHCCSLSQMHLTAVVCEIVCTPYTWCVLGIGCARVYQVNEVRGDVCVQTRCRSVQHYDVCVDNCDIATVL